MKQKLSQILGIYGKGNSQETHNSIKIGMCSDVHLPTMQDSESRISTFIDSMTNAKPDFIIELGDFGTPSENMRPFLIYGTHFQGKNIML